MALDRIVVGERKGLFGGRRLGGGVTIQLEGVQGVTRRVQEWAEQDKRALRRGMAKAGNFLLARSKELVPVKTGRLYSSGKMQVLNDENKMPRYIVSYATDYALYVHEDMAAFHPVGQAKFLEQPAREYRLHLIHLIQEEVRKATRGRSRKAMGRRG